MKRIQSLALYGCVCLLASPVFAASAPMTATAPQKLSDAEILGIVMTVDESEIAAANVAKTKKISHMVKRYAMYIKRQHEMNLKQLHHVSKVTHIEPSSSSLSQTMVKGGVEGLKALEALNGKAFESAYIHDMVQGHEDGLKLIKTKLLKNVSNSKVKKFLMSFQTMVQHHLKKAMHIEKTM